MIKPSLVLLLASLSATVSCKRSAPEERPTHERRADRSIVLTGASANYVRVERAEKAIGTSSRSLVARISFDERHVARLGAPVSGRVGTINVVTGDRVKRGDVLLTLLAPDLAGAQAQVAEAKTARQLAERTADRARMLAKEGAGSEAEVLQTEAALTQAKNEEQRATAALAAIGGGHGSGYELRAPLAGTVVERNVAVGSQVGTSQTEPLVVVGDIATVWVLADVYEQDLTRIKVGATATVRVLALGKREYSGTVTSLSDVVDKDSRVARARIELGNDDGALRPGMFAQVDVRGSTVGAADVPTSAVLARRDQYFVFVQREDGSYQQREVVLGEQHGQHVTILEGIAAGDAIVTEGAILLDVEANEAL